MKNTTTVRIANMLMRVLLLIIVGAYIYLKTSAADNRDTTTGETSAVLKSLETNAFPMPKDTISYAGILLLERIKAGAVDIGQHPPFPGTVYVRKIKQSAIYNY
jgi:hypothetical protein